MHPQKMKKLFIVCCLVCIGTISIAQYNKLDSTLLARSVTYKDAAIHCIIPFEIGFSENKNHVKILYWGDDLRDTAIGFVDAFYDGKTPITTLSIYMGKSITVVLSCAPAIKDGKFSDELEFSFMYRENGEVIPIRNGIYKKRRFIDGSNVFKEQIVTSEGMRIIISDNFKLHSFSAGKRNFMLLNDYTF